MDPRSHSIFFAQWKFGTSIPNWAVQNTGHSIRIRDPNPNPTKYWSCALSVMCIDTLVWILHALAMVPSSPTVRSWRYRNHQGGTVASSVNTVSFSVSVTRLVLTPTLTLNDPLHPNFTSVQHNYTGFNTNLTLNDPLSQNSPRNRMDILMVWLNTSPVAPTLLSAGDVCKYYIMACLSVLSSAAAIATQQHADRRVYDCPTAAHSRQVSSHVILLDVQSACPSADRWSHSHAIELTRRCYN